MTGAIEALRKERGLSISEALNLLVREGLSAGAGAVPPRRYRTKARALDLRPGIDPTRLGKLADEIESEAASRSLRRPA